MTPFTAGFIAACIALIAVEIGVIMGAVIFLVVRVRRTAESVEVLAYRVEESVNNVSESLTSGWMRGLQAAASLATGLWRGRHKDD